LLDWLLRICAPLCWKWCINLRDSQSFIHRKIVESCGIHVCNIVLVLLHSNGTTAAWYEQYLATTYFVAVSIPTVATTIHVGLNSIPSLVDGR
jgi:hypothetical protein